MSNDWADYELRPALKTAGIYDPDTIALQEIVMPQAGRRSARARRSRRSSADRRRGARQDHGRALPDVPRVGGTGAELGPALDGWGRGKSAEVIATAHRPPDAEIAHGYEGTELRTKDGLTIQGLLIKQGDPLMMRSMGGVTQIIPADRVADAPAHEGVADDERGAARPHRPGRRRPRRVPPR